ncbi:exported hypothetical protein [Planktothrix serta PCC 8927]|uniref:Uncharacterized protein n=1 Tax=Planktothrix serta PCC 8927 TaxID=671068 RepID=A0A7Z9E084_9CYAN|nr:hypothetical protein [Planktothrix serta]VXD21446.1 exported hypothetical protein [Planktothrix serta PCC 8927]
MSLSRLSHWINLKKNSRKLLLSALGIIALILILQFGNSFRTPTPKKSLSIYQPLTEIPATAQKVTVGVPYYFIPSMLTLGLFFPSPPY